MSYNQSVVQVSGEKKADIMLYALSTCPWCKKTKALLNELGLEYRYVDVDLLEGDARQDAMKDVEKCNDRFSFPTIEVNGSECIVGFKEDKIRELNNA